MNVTVIGNGAHATGAPISLLSILERRPPEVSLRTVLLGGGPLTGRYEAVSDQLHVLEIPTVRGLRTRRVVEEVRLARQLYAATRPRSPNEVLVVNTIEYEAALFRAKTWPHQAKVMIRESKARGTGFRGRARVALLRSAPSVSMAAVGELQAREWRDVLGRDVERRVNVYEAGEASDDTPGTGPIRFLVVGGASQIKGVDLAVEAFEAMACKDGARLVVASGDFDPRDEDGVLWTGYVPDLGRHMARHGDVLLGASRHEAFARAVVEAGLAGLPTLAWDVEGYSEQIRVLGGRVVAPYDTRALAEAMDEIVGQGRTALAARGVDVRRRARQEFDAETAAAAWWEWILG